MFLTWQQIIFIKTDEFQMNEEKLRFYFMFALYKYAFKTNKENEGKNMNNILIKKLINQKYLCLFLKSIKYLLLPMLFFKRFRLNNRVFFVFI